MGRETNVLNVWGNKESMNLNSMILTNIQSSTYFKQKLFELKTYHEVIDEIYYRVTHLEPWEKGSRRTQGLTGMCGGVRGVGGGGIVSTAYCLLYKLYTLKLTRKQVLGLISHNDSPYIRGLGLMYVRYTQNPQDLYTWFSDYLDDEEELDVKAGGGMMISIGQMLRRWLIRLEWFDTLFPRIPVLIQKEIMDSLRDKYGNCVDSNAFYEGGSIVKRSPPPELSEALKDDRKRAKTSRSRDESKDRRERRGRRSHSRDKSRERSRDRSSSRRHSSKRKVSRSRSKDSSERRHRRKHKHSRHHKSHRHEDHSSEREGSSRNAKRRSHDE